MNPSFHLRSCQAHATETHQFLIDSLLGFLLARLIVSLLGLCYDMMLQTRVFMQVCIYFNLEAIDDHVQRAKVKLTSKMNLLCG